MCGPEGKIASTRWFSCVALIASAAVDVATSISRLTGPFFADGVTSKNCERDEDEGVLKMNFRGWEKVTESEAK